MKRILILIPIPFIFLIIACDRDISLQERDHILEKAFSEIISSDASAVANGLRTIKKYPTYEGLMKTIYLWETDVPGEVEENILDTLKAFELFRNDPSLIKDVFNRNYSAGMSEAKKSKLRRLLTRTNVKIKKALIDMIDQNQAN